MSTAPRTDLFRVLCPAGEIRMDRGGSGRTFSGRLVPYNNPTMINSWEGRFMEQFAPGAFTHTLRGLSAPSDLPFLYDHGMDPSIGNKPVGVYTSIEERADGLYVEGTMIDRPYADDITEAVRVGGIKGMSVRFSIRSRDGESWDNDLEPPVRTVRDAAIYEGSIVTFPAYAATTAGVRSGQAYEHWRRGWDTDHPVVTTDAPVPQPLGRERSKQLETIRAYVNGFTT